MPLRVLYVCTGNICRSPMAELMFRAAATPDGRVVITSAGLDALVDAPIDGGSATVLREYGLDPGRHRGRQFEPSMAEQADLVLTAQRAHRDAVMAEAPRAFRRTFTMREFARLSVGLDDPDPRAVIARAAGRRGMFGEVPLTADDIDDPYQQGLGASRSTAHQIIDTVRSTVVALSLLPPPPPPVVPPDRSAPGPAAARRPRPYRS